MILSRHRLVAVGPVRPLVNQSPVLARLAREPRGTRIIDCFGNLPMLVGLEPVAAYRTLDLPALEPLNHLARERLGPEGFPAGVRQAMRAAGVGVRVLDPVETAIDRWLARSKGSKDEPETVDDPILAGWIFGRDWRSEQGAWSSRFRILHPESDPHRAWFLPLTAVSRPAMLEFWAGDLEPLLELFDRASPLREESRGPSSWTCPLMPMRPDGSSSRNWRTPSGGLAGWTGPVKESFRPRFCQHSGATAAREVGSEFGYPGPGAGRCTSSTWQATSPGDWRSHRHRG